MLRKLITASTEGRRALKFLGWERIKYSARSEGHSLGFHRAAVSLRALHRETTLAHLAELVVTDVTNDTSDLLCVTLTKTLFVDNIPVCFAVDK